MRKSAKRIERPVVPVELPPKMTVGELSDILGQTPVSTIKALMRLGQMLNVNEDVEFDLAFKVAKLFEVPVKKPKDAEESVLTTRATTVEETDKSNLTPKQPVITIIGHVDHGKTTLLDTIRGSAVTETEAGGITQHIGAYEAEYKGNKLTFIDTPGHEAFTSMRASGIQVTDIALLIVAADDGVMPQTKEAISHAKAANVPVLVAINKIDVPKADSDRVKSQLVESDIIAEDLGGEVLTVDISARDKQGIDELLEALLLVAEIAELKTNSKQAGIGVVVESNMDRRRGALGTVILSTGRMKVGDSIVSGTQSGKVRSMYNSAGQQIKEVEAGVPVQILGLNGVPFPGEKLEVVKSSKVAKDMAAVRKSMGQRHSVGKSATATMDDVRRSMLNRQITDELNVVVKADTRGSLEAIKNTLENSGSENIKVKVLHSDVGAVNESDVLLASASKAVIIAFSVPTETGAQRQIAKTKVAIKNYEIIYRLIEDVKDRFKGLLAPEKRRVVIGKAEVLQLFPYGRHSKIAGIRVIEGELKLKSSYTIFRDDKEIFTGKLSSMRHVKAAVTELKNREEGGLVFEDFNELAPGDTIECFEIHFE